MPRIDSVLMSMPQPQASDEAVIWYDDFDGTEKAYTESQGRLDVEQVFGGQGRSMLSWYEKGSRGTGNRKVFFGDSPTGNVVRKGQSFDDIYGRIYVKHQHGWTGGGPAKLSRATSIVSPKWSQWRSEPRVGKLYRLGPDPIISGPDQPCHGAAEE